MKLPLPSPSRELKSPTRPGSRTRQLLVLPQSGYADSVLVFGRLSCPLEEEHKSRKKPITARMQEGAIDFMNIRHSWLIGFYKLQRGSCLRSIKQ